MNAASLRAAYEHGATIEELALEHDLSAYKMRRLLHEAGTQMRPKGMRNGHPMRRRQDTVGVRGGVDPAARIANPRVARRYR